MKWDHTPANPDTLTDARWEAVTDDGADLRVDRLAALDVYVWQVDMNDQRCVFGGRSRTLEKAQDNAVTVWMKARAIRGIEENDE